MQRKPPARAPDFLRWAHSIPADCCLCADPAEELHHLENGGYGKRGSDLLLARVCAKHHREVQGKGRIAFERLGQLETWGALQSHKRRSRNATRLRKWNDANEQRPSGTGSRRRSR